MAAAAVGILGRRIASAVMSFEFMLAGNWVVALYHVADTMGGCLGMGGSVWADGRCRHLMSYPPAVAAFSLLLMLWLWRRELKAKAAGGRKDGRTDPELGMEKGPDRCCLRESDSVAVFGIIVVYSSCILVMFLGGMVRYAGENLLLKDPADKGAAAQVQTGFVISDVGILSFEFGHCFLFIPYMLLKFKPDPFHLMCISPALAISDLSDWDFLCLLRWKMSRLQGVLNGNVHFRVQTCPRITMIFPP